MLFFILTLGAAVCFAFGNVLAKSGVAKSGEKADIHHPIRFIVSFLTSKRWWTGFCLSALGNVGNYTAMALYNLSLVKPISALNPVLTAIFGRIFLKEPINRRVVAAIVCVLCGLLFASSEVGEAPGVQNIPALCIFVGILLAFAFASHFIFRSPEVGDSITMGTCYGLSDVLYKSLAIDATAKGIQLSADELLYWIADVRVWAFAATYITAFVFTQVAFSRGRALFVIPFSAAIGAVVPILAGALVFAEPFPPAKIMSIALVILGSSLFIASPRQMIQKTLKRKKSHANK
ncbi:MAG: DMT family transporter [Fibrobacter sp.]|jgi:drug/metabolite transporter (DMT)-like permease|nr:DMT family transporter [Fibrobacter sp.]MDY6369569.1 DMT family transporter [Fibrobacter sp.]MDY6388885.1 DMT family transporter [Fibrobacter sp.]